METEMVRISNPNSRTHFHDGFTLVELLVVIAIIGILVALLLPAIQAAREAARRTQCINNLKQLGLAAQNYHDSNKDLPPARWYDKSPSWLALIQPYIEEAQAYDLWDFDENYTSANNKAAREVVIAGFYCPSRRSPTVAPLSPTKLTLGEVAGATGDYAGCAGSDMFGNPPPAGQTTDQGGVITSSIPWGNGTATPKPKARSIVAFRKITDGLSKTFLAGEKQVPPSKFGIADSSSGYGDASIYNGDYLQAQSRAAGISRFDGTEFPPSPDPNYGDDCPTVSSDCKWQRLFGSSHPGVLQFAMCDGSVQTVTTSVDLRTYSRLAVRNDGEIVDMSSL